MKSAMAFKGIARSPKQSNKAFASSTTRRASCLLPSKPNNFTYVVLLTDSSFPAVFPSSFEDAVTSRISSATTHQYQYMVNTDTTRDRHKDKSYFEKPTQSFPRKVHMPQLPQVRHLPKPHPPLQRLSTRLPFCGYESTPDLPT